MKGKKQLGIDEKFLCEIYVDGELYEEKEIKLKLIPEKNEKLVLFHHWAEEQKLEEMFVTVTDVEKVIGCEPSQDFVAFNIKTRTIEDINQVWNR